MCCISFVRHFSSSIFVGTDGASREQSSSLELPRRSPFSQCLHCKDRNNFRKRQNLPTEIFNLSSKVPTHGTHTDDTRGLPGVQFFSFLDITTIFLTSRKWSEALCIRGYDPMIYVERPWPKLSFS